MLALKRTSSTSACEFNSSDSIHKSKCGKKATIKIEITFKVLWKWMCRDSFLTILLDFTFNKCKRKLIWNRELCHYELVASGIKYQFSWVCEVGIHWVRCNAATEIECLMQHALKMFMVRLISSSSMNIVTGIFLYFMVRHRISAVTTVSNTNSTTARLGEFST